MQSQDTTTPPQHTVEAFNAAFASIEARRDLNSGSKRLHALLVSAHRRRASWTHAEMARQLGAGMRSIVRWSNQLVDAGLLSVKRPGLGKPNEYTLLGIDRDNLSGRAVSIRVQAKRVYAARYARLVALYGEQCLNCGSTDELEIDHVIARARGGPDVFLNLQILCRPCNADKGIKTADYRPSPGVALASLTNPA
jgi:hypothetical protein